MDSQLNLGNRPHVSLLDRKISELGSLGLIGVDFISNKDMYVSITFIAFSIVLFINLMHASTCPLF